MTQHQKPPLAKIIAKNLKKRLIDLEWTQIKLAEKMNVTQSTVSLWCTGSHAVDLWRLQELADALECPVEALLKKTEP